jgi:sugar lactone lactonase YvrE
LNNRIVEWKSNATKGEVAAGGNGKGNQNNQLDRPGDLIIEKETNSLIISDLENRRIVRWPRQSDSIGQVVIKDIDCDGITMDKNGFLYISDPKKHEVRRWKIGDKSGTIVAGGNGPGNDLNQLNYPTCVFVDQDFSLYVSDCLNNRIVKWVKDAKEGIVVAGGNDQGYSLSQLHCPQGVIVDQLGQIYVADWGNHRVMRWCEGVQEGTVIVGGNEPGEQPNQLNCPIGISFDVQGNLYVADFENNRIQKFEIE